MKTLTLCFASRYGQTERIANRLCRKLIEQGIDARSQNIVTHPDFPETDYYVVGAPIMYGKAWTPFRKWINNHQQVMDGKIIGAFNVNLTARKPGKRHVNDNPYFAKLLALLPGEVALRQVFAGALDYPQYNRIDRFMIRLIMQITGGPKRSGHRIDYTFWPDVDSFAESISDYLATKP